MSVSIVHSCANKAVGEVTTERHVKAQKRLIASVNRVEFPTRGSSQGRNFVGAPDYATPTLKGKAEPKV